MLIAGSSLFLKAEWNTDDTDLTDLFLRFILVFRLLFGQNTMKGVRRIKIKISVKILSIRVIRVPIYRIKAFALLFASIVISDLKL